ncbi:MAG: hypothetical protein QM809_18660 [Gordonia sp. (in: high G+C Gram-positive bacteria)]|uniref:hypothetical protein n=1 Tax=Gordonia sp. (in: high G+C Gram-positive bacteria) TaxID=84139 RepID=UPI0039E39748
MTPRVWTALGALVAVVGVVLAIVGLDLGEHGADGSIAAVSFGSPQAINEEYYATYPSPHTPGSGTATAVDITLKNTGDSPLRIVRIEAKVLDETMINCSRQGGGSVVSAFYSIVIPYHFGKLTSDSTSAPVNFTVKPDSVDRMVITVGPKETINGHAIVLGLQLRLIPESGDPIEVEPFAVSQPESVSRAIKLVTSGFLQRGDTDNYLGQCATEQVSALDRIFQVTKVQADDVKALRTTYAGVAT